jgi:uncharacterized glyoxalase superfamily protein PhnB
MLSNRSMPQCDVIPELAYPDVAAAVAWLVEVFGFRLRLGVGRHRAQLDIGRGALIVKGHAVGLFAQAEPAGDPTHSIMVRVTDVDAHYRRAAERRAHILQPPADFPYGERQYTVCDLGGHIWTFSESRADVAPDDWGGSWTIDPED